MIRPPRFALPVPPAAIGFRPEFLDFERGIRVGNLEDNERITRILKLALEYRYQEAFVTERWGRGVFWQWIGYLTRSNRAAKPISSAISFGCSKFFLSVDTKDREFCCGMQVERGFIKAPPDFSGCELKDDWDWNRLIRQLGDSTPLGKELKRLISREGFHVHAGSWETDGSLQLSGKAPDIRKLARTMKSAPAEKWAGLQVYYPLPEDEVRGMSGLDLVEAMLAVFGEVTPLMNFCMQTELESRNQAPSI
jgi:hypothetical protein